MDVNKKHHLIINKKSSSKFQVPLTKLITIENTIKALSYNLVHMDKISTKAKPRVQIFTTIAYFAKSKYQTENSTDLTEDLEAFASKFRIGMKKGIIH